MLVFQMKRFYGTDEEFVRLMQDELGMMTRKVGTGWRHRDHIVALMMPPRYASYVGNQPGIGLGILEPGGVCAKVRRIYARSGDPNIMQLQEVPTPTGANGMVKTPVVTDEACREIKPCTCDGSTDVESYHYAGGIIRVEPCMATEEEDGRWHLIHGERLYVATQTEVRKYSQIRQLAMWAMSDANFERLVRCIPPFRPLTTVEPERACNDWRASLHERVGELPNLAADN